MSSCWPTRDGVIIDENLGDRNGLPQARLNGIEDDLGLKGEQYNACISILYVGYLLAGIPSNMLLTRIRPSIYLGVW